MKRDVFRRPQRMVFKFGETERANDPLGSASFDFAGKHMLMPGQGRSAPSTVQKDGEHQWSPPRSPIQKPSGRMASICGPSPDVANVIAYQVPDSTKKRKVRS